MRRWDPINARQLSLLTRIGSGEMIDFAGERLVLTLRSLRDRGLVEARCRYGAWDAAITAAGDFYIEHGHHPDRPSAPRESRRTSKRGSGTAPAQVGDGLSRATTERSSDRPVKPLRPATQREVNALYRGLDVPKLAFTLQQAATAASVSTSMLVDAIHGRHDLLPSLTAKRAGDRYLVTGLELLRWIESLPDAHG